MTFDIGCQYSKNFWEWVKKFPLEMQMSEDTVIKFAIPSWCHVPFLFVPVTIILTFVRLQHISFTSVFHLPSSISYLSSDLLNPLPFCLLSSIFRLYFNFSLLTSIFRLLSYVPFLLLYFHHLSIIPCLPFPTLTT